MSEYDTDFMTWTVRQAELLRRRAAGELVNEAEIDWQNIAEEIASVGGIRVASCAIAWQGCCSTC